MVSIKLETLEPGPVTNQMETPRSTLLPEPVNKMPIIVIRANEAQLTVLNASFAENQSPKKAELDRVSKETGLCVYLLHLNSPEATRSRTVSSVSTSSSLARFLFYRCWCPMIFSTLKWIKSWYGRKRCIQKKALGILAVKAEAGDPMIPASVTISNVQPQPRPTAQLDENISVAPRATKLLDARNKSITRTVKAPFRRYAPYTNSKIIAPTSTSSDDHRPQPFNSAQNQRLAHSQRLESNLNTIAALPSKAPTIKNTNHTDGIIPPKEQNPSDPHKWVKHPDAEPSSFRHSTVHNYDSHHSYNHNFIQDAKRSYSLLPAFDISPNVIPIIHSDITPIPLQDHYNQAPILEHNLSTFYTPVMDASLAIGRDMSTVMDDSASVSCGNFPDVVERIQSRQSPHATASMNTDVDYNFPFVSARFVNLRQGERPHPQFCSQRNTEITVSVPPSPSADITIPRFDIPPKIRADWTQQDPSKSQLAFHGTPTISYFSAAPAPIRAHIPTQEKPNIALPGNSSPSISSTHQFQAHTSLKQLSSPSPYYQPQLSISRPTPTPNSSSSTKINDISSENKTAASDLINLTLRSLATEEDTFTAAIMLVVLSKAGFVWDY